MAMRLQRGPKLPYRLLAGVVSCPGGWMVASARLQGITMYPQEPEVLRTFVEVLDSRPSYSVIGLAIPVGLLDRPRRRGRNCEQAARKLLPWPRSGAILSAPSRAALGAKTYEEAQAVNEGMSPVVWNQLPRIAEVAREIQPYWQRTVFEVHPEMSFYQLNDDTSMRYSKRSPLGVKERRELLETKIQGIERILDGKAKGANKRHLVDAAACLWTARRIASRAVNRLPEDPEWDTEGLRMEIMR